MTPKHSCMQAGDAKDAVKVWNMCWRMILPGHLRNSWQADDFWCIHLRIDAADSVLVLLTQDTFSGADNKADEAGNKAKGERRLKCLIRGVLMCNVHLADFACGLPDGHSSCAAI